MQLFESEQTPTQAEPSMVEQPQLFATPQLVTTSDDYYTPPHIFDRLGLHFDLDVCAPPGGIEWIPASDYYTQEDNALIAPWYGRVWMNPPFSNPTPFVEKFIAHGNGVALVPTSNGRWMGRLWEANVAWVALDYLRFHDGATRQEMKASIPLRCWLVAAGPKCEAALAKFGRVR